MQGKEDRNAEVVIGRNRAPVMAEERPRETLGDTEEWSELALGALLGVWNVCRAPCSYLKKITYHIICIHINTLNYTIYIFSLFIYIYIHLLFIVHTIEFKKKIYRSLYTCMVSAVCYIPLDYILLLFFIYIFSRYIIYYF